VFAPRKKLRRFYETLLKSEKHCDIILNPDTVKGTELMLLKELWQKRIFHLGWTTIVHYCLRHLLFRTFQHMRRSQKKHIRFSENVKSAFLHLWLRYSSDGQKCPHKIASPEKQTYACLPFVRAMTYKSKVRRKRTCTCLIFDILAYPIGSTTTCKFNTSKLDLICTIPRYCIYWIMRMSTSPTYCLVSSTSM